jgi:hypothetical protein
MNYPGRTVFVFGCYMLLLGVPLLLAPNLLLGLFGFPPTDEVWVRILGLLVLYLGAYYMLAGRKGIAPFIAATVPIRASVIFVFAAFVAADMVSPMLLVLGVPDVIGAWWTWQALRSQRLAGAVASA